MKKLIALILTNMASAVTKAILNQVMQTSLDLGKTRNRIQELTKENARLESANNELQDSLAIMTNNYDDMKKRYKQAASLAKLSA